MNEIVNKFILGRNKFMPEMHLRQRRFTYSACGPFTRNKKKRIQKFKVRRDSRCIYQNELDKACFQHDITYEDFKDLTRKTAYDKILRDKAFNIAKNLKDDGYQSALASIVHNVLNKKISATRGRSETLRLETLATSAMRKNFPGSVLKMRIFQTKN